MHRSRQAVKPRAEQSIIPSHYFDEPIKVVYVKMVKEIVEAEEANKKKED